MNLLPLALQACEDEDAALVLGDAILDSDAVTRLGVALALIAKCSAVPGPFAGAYTRRYLARLARERSTPVAVARTLRWVQLTALLAEHGIGSTTEGGGRSER